MLHVLILLATLIPATSAAAPDMPTDADISRARAEGARIMREALTRQGELTKQRGEMQRALEQARRQAPRIRMPDIDKLPEPDAAAIAKAKRDIAQLLEHPDQALETLKASDPSRGTTAPIVFVSFSMPETALRGYLEQAARLQSPVVLRGFVGESMKETLDRILALLYPDGIPTGETATLPPQYQGLALAIDPTLFSRFDIGQVPAIVLPAEPIPPCTRDGCPVPRHVKLAGDVGLPYALDLMAREASDPILARLASDYRRQLEATP